jgi:DNA ligase (NAD+)
MNKKEYNDLVDRLIEYSNAYYKQNQSLISDKEFDLLLKQAQAIEEQYPEWARKDSPTVRPGSDVTGKFKTVKHNREMLSLENTYNYEEVEKWFLKMQKAGASTFIVEPKYDGNSFAARFVKGQLVQGLTRGDGTTGEDITQNCLLIEDLNHISNQFTGEIRGEIIMTNTEFERLNKDGKYANPRNLASGTIKLLDPNEFKKRKLISYVYWLEDSETPTHSASLQWMKKLGFRVGPAIVCHTLKDIVSAIERIEAMKKNDELDIDLDGAVLKVDELKLWPEIGSTSKFPQWARAYKYEPENALTRILDIEFWVGHAGKITPVAIMEPVFLSGTKVSKASLSNFNYIKEKDIRIGDQVKVKKAAEIIPQVMYPIKDVRTGKERLVITPTQCPTCGSPLSKWNEDHADIFCKNEQCPSQVVGTIAKYCSVMDMDGFGEKIIQRFYDEKLLMNIADLYTLKNHYATLITLDRLGKKVVDKLLERVELSKSMPLGKFIEAISIKNTGQGTAKRLLRYYDDIDQIMNATYEDLLKIEDIGGVVARSLVDYFKQNRSFIETLRKHGVNLKSEPKNRPISGGLAGMKICITGTLSRPRKEYEDLISAVGGEFVEEVTKTTNLLVTNDPNSGSSKLKNAAKYGTKIVNEENLMTLLKGNNTMKAETKKATGGVAGLKICITGTLSKPRKDYEKAIAAAGGEAVDEVTKTTNILVTNDPNAGSSKLKNAAKHGTKIMSEADLVKLLGIK